MGERGHHSDEDEPRPAWSFKRRLIYISALVLLFEVVQQYSALSRLVQHEDRRDETGNHELLWSPLVIETASGETKKSPTTPRIIRRSGGSDPLGGKSDPKKRIDIDTLIENWQQPARYDVTNIRRQSPLSNNNQNMKDMVERCKIQPGQGAEGAHGFQGLAKIQVYNANAITNDLSIWTSEVQPKSQKTILCIVLTDSTRHDGPLQAIVDTYGPKCDGFLAASNQSNPKLGAVDLLSSIMMDTSSISSSSREQKDWDQIRHVWHYIYNNYRNDYDFFHLGPDDMYLIPENLKYFLSNYGTSTNLLEDERDDGLDNTTQLKVTDEGMANLPLYLGGAVVASRTFPERRHCGGGSGYTLNQAALTLFRTKLSNKHCASTTALLQRRPQPPPSPRTLSKMTSSAITVSVDRLMAECFNVANISCAKTTDQNSAIRYLEFGIDYQAQWSKQLKGPIKANPLKVFHGIYMPSGIQGISTSAVSIHLVNGTEPLVNVPISDAIRRVDVVLHRHCQEKWDQPFGALDVSGKSGYIHDATYVRNHPPPFQFQSPSDKFGVCEVPFGDGPEEKMGLVALQKIRIMDDVELLDRTRPIRIMCLIYTHSNRHDRVRAIAETFAPRCDGFMAASNLTDASIGAVNLMHEGPEIYKNMWLKVRSMWQYVYDNYLNDYDFFQIGGDDHYVIPENLRYVASTGSWRGLWNQSAPLYLGGPMLDYPHTSQTYCGGGAGYTLNRIALKLLIENAFPSYHCKPHFQASDEDRIISKCFRPLGIECMDTNDHLNETRYHAGRADFHATWNHSQPAPWRYEPLEKIHGIANLEGLGQISETSVSFHLKGPKRKFSDQGIRRYHAILYGLCNGTRP